MKNKIRKNGQALVTLLFFVVIAVTITSAAIIVIMVNSTSIARSQSGISAYYAAESGIEDALMRLLRDPGYAGGETLTLDSYSTAFVSVSGTNPKTVTSVGQSGNFKRTIQAQMTYSVGYYTISNWREI